nr:MAG TPA: RNA-directed RNA polymerase catalytic subunit [Caudoviricetes sp.]
MKRVVSKEAALFYIPTIYVKICNLIKACFFRVLRHFQV